MDGWTDGWMYAYGGARCFFGDEPPRGRGRVASAHPQDVSSPAGGRMGVDGGWRVVDGGGGWWWW